MLGKWGNSIHNYEFPGEITHPANLQLLPKEVNYDL